MADNELKRLLQGLFSDIPTEIAPEEAPLEAGLENARLLQEHERRIAELATINEIGQALSSALELDGLLETVHLQVSRLFDTANFYIATYEAGSDKWTSAFHLEQGQQQPKARYSIEAGLTGYIIRSHQSLLFRTREESIAFCQAQGVDIIGEVACSWLGVPLIAADKIVGVMAIQSYDHEQVYGDQDLALFSTIGAQVANALENLRLLKEAQLRTQQLAVLNEMGRALTAMLDVNAVFENVYQTTSRLMDTTNFYVALFDAAQDEIAFVLDIGEGKKRPEARRRSGKGLTEYVIRTREPLLIKENVRAHVDKFSGVEHIGQDAQSWLGVPMMMGGQVFGVIAVQSYTTPRLYHEQHRELLTAVASQAAIALQNARLFEETQEAARRLGEERSLLRTLIDSLPDNIFVKDRESRFVIDNKAHLRLLKATAQDEVVGKTDFDIFPEELARQYYNDEQEIMRTGQPLIDREEYTLDETGKVQWLWTTKVPLRDSRGRIAGLVGINRNITERKRAESERDRLLAEAQELTEALRVSEERYAMALQASNTGLWDWDIANNILYWSPELKGLLGYADDELTIDFPTFESLLHPDDSRRTSGAIDAHLKDRVPYEVEQRLRAKSGEYRWFLIRGQAIWDEAGNPVRMTGFSTDISERKEAEATIERRRRQLECLSDIGQKIGESLPLAGFLHWVAERIPPAMQFPDLCVAAIEFEGQAYGVAEALHLPCQMVQSLRLNDRQVGRMCIAYTEERDFLDEESALLGDITRRISSYIQSYRLFEQTQAALAEVEATHRSYLRRSWQDHLRQREMLQRSGFLYDASVPSATLPSATLGTGGTGRTGGAGGAELAPDHPALIPAPDIWRPEMERAVLEGSPAIAQDKATTGTGSLTATGRTGLAIPITLRGETIGVLGVEAPGDDRQWTEDDIALIQTVGDQLGQTLETARLFADTQRRAERERLIGEITTKIRASTDMRDILETAAVELGQALGTSRAFVRVGIESESGQRAESTEPAAPSEPGHVAPRENG